MRYIWLHRRLSAGSVTAARQANFLQILRSDFRMRRSLSNAEDPFEIFCQSSPAGFRRGEYMCRPRADAEILHLGRAACGNALLRRNPAAFTNCISFKLRLPVTEISVRRAHVHARKFHSYISSRRRRSLRLLRRRRRLAFLRERYHRLQSRRQLLGEHQCLARNSQCRRAWGKLRPLL